MSSSKGFQAVGQASTVLDLDRAQNARANFNTIKRMDPQTSAILSSANHCSLYEQTTAQQWMKMDVEGPVFLVRRDGQPAHRLILLNRLGRVNWGLDVHSLFDFDLKHPGKYMFQDQSQQPAKTYALWCPEADIVDALAMMNMLQDVCRASPRPDTFASAQTPATSQQQTSSLVQIRASGSPSNLPVSGKGQDMSPSVAALFSLGAPLGVVASSTPVALRSASTGAAPAGRPDPVAGSGIEASRPASSPGSAPLAAVVAPASHATAALGGPLSSSSSMAASAPAGGTSVSLAQALSKQACKEALIELVQDEMFLELFHSKYKLTLARLLKAGKAAGTAHGAGGEAQV